MSDRIIDWLFGVMARPVSTLNEIAREKPVGWALLVYLGVTILVLLASIYGDESYRMVEESLLELGLYLPISGLVIGVLIFAVAALFASAGILHLLARLFGGTGGYWNLFSAYGFTDFPMIISAPVTLFAAYLGTVGSILSALIAFGLSVWVIVLQVIAVRESHNLSTGASIGAYVIYFVVLAAIILAIVAAFVVALIMAV